MITALTALGSLLAGVYLGRRFKAQSYYDQGFADGEAMALSYEQPYRLEYERPIRSLPEEPHRCNYKL